MAEEILETVDQPEIVADPFKTYKDEIEKLKRTTVPINQYNQLVNENKALFEANMTNAAKETEETKPVDKETLKEQGYALSQQLFSEDPTNLVDLERAKKAIEYRHVMKEAYGIDPFVFHGKGQDGKDILPTDQEIADADYFEEALKAMIENADGDNSIYCNEEQRHIRKQLQ